MKLVIKFLFIVLGLISSFFCFSKEKNDQQISTSNHSIKYFYKPKGKIIAIGDIHASPERFVDALIGAGVLNQKGKFVGENIDIVLTGDFANKGESTLAVWDIISFLYEKAKTSNSRIHALFGNHDIKILRLKTKKISKNDLLGFMDYGQNLEEGLKMAINSDPYKEMMKKWKGTVRIGEFTFVHGGFERPILNMNPEKFNKTVRDYVLKQLKYIEDSLSEPNSIKPKVPLILKEDHELTPKKNSHSGPLSSQKMAKAKMDEELFKQILDHMGAKFMVVGHSITEDGFIEEMYNGRLIKIDTGISSPKGNVSALKIDPKTEEVIKLNSLPKGIYEEAYAKFIKKKSAKFCVINILEQKV